MKQKKIISLLIIFIVFLIIISILSYNVLQSSSLLYSTFFVQADDDDSRTFIAENSELGYGDEDGKWALLQLSPSYSFGIRFTNVTIPNGARIREAYVKLYSIGTPSASHPNCMIYGDGSSNAQNFSVHGVLHRCGRNYTDASILWEESLPYSTWVRTPNLQQIIQEVVNKKDWNQGNALAILFVTNEERGFSASFQNVESGYPAALLIKWEKPIS